MIDRDKLAALHELATKGEWKTHGFRLGYKGDIIAPTAEYAADCHRIAQCFAPEPVKQPLSDLEQIAITQEAINLVENNAALIALLCSESARAEILALMNERDRLREAMAAVAAECVVPVGTDEQMYQRWRKLATDRVDIARAALGD